jgi:hypothetical protein
VPGNPAASFATHSNYLRAVAMLAGFDTLVPNDLQILTNLAQAAQASAMYQGLVQHQANLPELRRSLHNAWASELVLAIPGRFTNADSVIRLANHWGVVQLYYVLYHATQAFHIATGNPRPANHPATQRIYTSTWGRAGALLPWNLTADANGYGQFPANWQVDLTVNPFTPCNPANVWDYAAMALRTTRKKSVGDAWLKERKNKTSQKRKAWQAVEQTRLAKGRQARKKPAFGLSNLLSSERTAVDNGVRAHSLIDYAYRLRIKTNYEDAEMFTEGPPNMAASGHVNRDIVRLAAASLLLVELHIARMSGPQQFAAIADGWLQTHVNLPPQLQVALRVRRHLLP